MDIYSDQNHHNMKTIRRLKKYASRQDKQYDNTAEITDARWQYDDDDNFIYLGCGNGFINYNPNNMMVTFAFIQDIPNGPYGEYDSRYGMFEFDEQQGVLTVKGKTRDGRPYTFTAVYVAGSER